MLFQSQAARLVNDALRAAIGNADRQRKERAQKQLLFYQDEQELFIRADLDKRYVAPSRLTPVSVNAVKKIIRNLAMVYIQDARRRVEGTEADQAIFAEIETTASLPVMMKQANRLSKLLGTVLARPIWRGGRMEMDILPPDILDVTWGDTPADLQEVVVTVNDPDGNASAVTYSRWTAEIYQKLDYRGQVIESEPNPYGRLPFVPIWSQPPLDNFWLTGAADLIMAQDAINTILTCLLHTLRFQSFSLLYTKGANVSKNDDFMMGPGVVVNLPQDGDIGFTAPNAPIADALTSVETLMKQAAITNGLSASSVSLDPTNESGVAKIVGNSELEELRADDLALFARYEDQLFDLFRTIWNVHNPGRKISESAVLWCDFYNPEPTQTPYEKSRTWNDLLDMGVISKVDIVMQMNPDLNREQAIKQLENTQAEIKRFGDALPSLTSYQDGMAPLE